MEARLEFNGFQLNTCYFHEAILGSALSEHYAGQFSTLSFRRQAAIVDLAGSHRGTHRFYLGEDKTFTLDETMAPDNFDEVVSATVGLQRYETTNGIGMAYRLEPYAEFYPGTLMVTVTNLINAERTFGDITDELVRKIEGIRREQAREVVFKIARDLWMRGVLLFVG